MGSGRARVPLVSNLARSFACDHAHSMLHRLCTAAMPMATPPPAMVGPPGSCLDVNLCDRQPAASDELRLYSGHALAHPLKLVGRQAPAQLKASGDALHGSMPSCAEEAERLAVEAWRSGDSAV